MDPVSVGEFRVKASKCGFAPLVVHMPYLPNLASHDDDLYLKSVESLLVEMDRCRELGVDYLVTHVGKTKGGNCEAGLERVAEAVSKALNAHGPVILLENTAGQGSELGHRVEELGEIITRAGGSPSLGICLDTAHAFQAGYPLHTPGGLDALLKEVEEFVGLERLSLLHLNDSKTPLGSRVDRHWHIGEGSIGLEGFRLIINHSALCGLPAIMETPGGDSWDRRNLELVRRLDLH